MKVILKILGAIFGFIFFIAFSLVLSLSPVVLSLGILVTNRETPIRWLDTIDAYEEITKIVKDSVSEGLSKEITDPSELGDNFMMKAISDSITPKFVEDNMIAIVNGVYDFLEGKTETLKLETQNLDISGTIVKFVPKEETELIQLMKNIKPCTPTQAFMYEEKGGFSSIEDICLPPNFDIVKVVDDSYNKEIENKDVGEFITFFKPQELDQKTLDYIKLGFTLLKYSPYILTGVLVILLTLYFLVFPGKYFKGYVAGLLMMFVGIVYFIAATVTFLRDILFSITDPVFQSTEIPIDVEFIELFINTVLDDVFGIIRIVGGIIAIVGIIVVLGTIIIQAVKNGKKETIPPSPTSSTNSSTNVQTTPSLSQLPS